jgi:hypothetical protein
LERPLKEPIEFIVFESEESNAVLISFGMKILTILTYKGVFLRDCSSQAILKEHPEFHIPILAIHID